MRLWILEHIIWPVVAKPSNLCYLKDQKSASRIHLVLCVRPHHQTPQKENFFFFFSRLKTNKKLVCPHPHCFNQAIVIVTYSHQFIRAAILGE